VGGLSFGLSDLGVLADQPEPIAGISSLLGIYNVDRAGRR
jgi:hypothetical protein